MFASLDEARILLGLIEGDPDDLAGALRHAGPGEVVVMLGQDDAVCADREGKVYRDHARHATRVDLVVADDSFVAGCLGALLGGNVPRDCPQPPVFTAFSVSAEGDWEGPPAAAELAAASATDIER